MIKRTSRVTVERIPISQLQVIEHSMPWVCHPENFQNYLKLLQDNPDEDLDPIVVKPNRDYPGIFQIINGKHRFCANVMASRKDMLCLVVVER